MMACCNAMADCMLESKDIEQALIWLIEVDVLNKSMFLTNPTPAFEWFSMNVDIEDHFVQCITAYVKLSQIYLELGNTGNAVHKIWSGTTNMEEIPARIDKTKLKRLIPDRKVTELTRLRHPDPQLSSKLTFANSELQIRGSWKKLSIRKTGGMGPRMGFASFVWNGFLYVAGGEKALDGPFYRDFWRLNLSSLGAWEPLPSYPPSQSTTGNFFSWSMAVCDDKAYLFNGRLSLDVFDLKSGAWSTVATRFKSRTGSSKWPYPKGKVTEYAMQIVDKTLYIFGGVHSEAALGCNLLLGLNLETLQWEHLSGTAEPVADFGCPGPRRYASSWVDRARGRLMIMFGEADRMGAKLAGKQNGGFRGHGYDDIWSWDTRERSWRRERIMGNAPCPRSEMASTWNEKLNHAVVFGGYSPTLPTVVEETDEAFSFSYYADTFIWDASASPPKWKQVLTHGFPTYRAQSQLFSDPLTGKTFLFGGFTNSEFVPSRKHCISRSFGDLWQLRIDQPGGYFEGVDLAEEARTAKAGPYRRCFTCGGAGSWKQCGAGSCNGRAFFCDPECFKEGWKEHKKRHGCQKKT
ncbi:hypothetical protein FIBSPDRAFT_799744 [Athelia psychrophila]|uniref:Uncharacterized protein n=1 Tax=Athelia psychrophila TaxID=1759441 RepID=A0A166ASH5_9AGAM|nr:hypothetical protein FIBSPDRAFT_799744 [Fibularhizoctonia sp. CBS 109695]